MVLYQKNMIPSKCDFLSISGAITTPNDEYEEGLSHHLVSAFAFGLSELLNQGMHILEVGEVTVTG